MAKCPGEEATVQVRCDWSTRRPSLAVIEALAAMENVEPFDLPTTLHDHVDPEALDRLVTGEKDITVSFPVGEYQVRIDGDQLTVTFD